MRGEYDGCDEFGNYYAAEYGKLTGVELVRNNTSFSVPEFLDSIGSFAFSPYSELITVHISGVTIIEDNAFEDSKELVAVKSSSNVTEIRDRAFGGCVNLYSFEMSDTVMIIGDRAFEWCAKLSSIVIPGSVEKIGDSAFEWCENLSYVIIKDGVKTIGNYAFKDCLGLKFILIPKSIISIGDLALNYCQCIVIEEGPIRDKLIENYAEKVEQGDRLVGEFYGGFTEFKNLVEDENLRKAAVAYANFTLAMNKIEKLSIDPTAQGGSEAELMIEANSQRECFQNTMGHILFSIDMSANIWELYRLALSSCGVKMSAPYADEYKPKYNKVLALLSAGIYDTKQNPQDKDALLLQYLFKICEDQGDVLMDDGGFSIFENLEEFLEKITEDGRVFICQLLSDIAQCQKDMGFPLHNILKPFQEGVEKWVSEHVQLIIEGIDVLLITSMFSIPGGSGAEISSGGGRAFPRI